MSDRPDTPKYQPTGQWEVRHEFDSNWERHVRVLVDPKGVVDSTYVPDDAGQAQGWADTYNLNDDKAAEFRRCPYCESGCPWCS